MTNLYLLLKLMLPLLAALLLATTGIEAQEGNMRGKDRILGTIQSAGVETYSDGQGNRIISNRRRLHKSNKDSFTHTYWYVGDSKASKSKSQKSAKSNATKATFDPWMAWMGIRPIKPTRKPTRHPAGKPTPWEPTLKPSVTPPSPALGDKLVEITTGGVLTANNLGSIPLPGSEQMKSLAQIFEETILSSLEDGYKCIVYEIGGIPVSIGNVRTDMTFNRHLQVQSLVRFTLRVTTPCPDCDNAGAMKVGTMVFYQTFQLLDSEAKSGDMTATFCGKAEGSEVVSSPCQVTITSAEGTSLDVKFVDDTTKAPKPTYSPTTMPPVKWVPTLSPTLKPVTSTPSTRDDTAPPTNGTAHPTTASPLVFPSTANPTKFSLKPSSPSETTAPSVASYPLGTVAPSGASVLLSISPTSNPAGAIYYTGFEAGKFPNDSFWSTTESTPWIIDSERVHTGVFSIKSPDLASSDLTPRDSNVTFTTGDSFPEGTLVLNILAGTQMPFDDVQYFVDGVYQGRLDPSSYFERFSVPVGPGQHEITFTYKYNPVGLPAFPPTGDFDHIAAIYIDDVYFLPIGVTMTPTTARASVQPTLKSNPQTFAPAKSNITTMPTSGSTSFQPVTTSTFAPSFSPQTTSNSTTLPPSPPISTSPSSNYEVPTYSPTLLSVPTPIVPNYSPTLAPSNLMPPFLSPSIFDGFESGNFSQENWTVAGVEAWTVDETKPYEGLYSAHVRTEDIPGSKLYSELSLPVSLEEPGFIQFYFYAPISQPFESFELWVDGQFLTPLATEGGEWAQAGSILSSGDHNVTWRYSNNPAGAPDEVLDTVPQPDFRLGEAWLDNVKLIGSTKSFTENWDSGDFSANPWILSGDGNWTITDAVKFEGNYSATIASADIDATNGTSDLSIDLITEKGGSLICKLLPSLQTPLDHFEILIDGIKVIELSEIQNDWQTQELKIQPGKRQVTFRLIKNPNNLDEDVMSSLPQDPNHQGQVWLDNCVFEANS